MKASEMIRIYDDERRNDIDSDTKLRWLRTFEQQNAKETFDTHEFTPEEKEGAFSDFDSDKHFSDFGYDTELMIPEPYSEVYIFYLDTRAAFRANEQERYSLASSLFNNAYITFQQYWNRTHKPKAKPIRFFDHGRLR